MANHYVYMNGSRGCMPDNTGTCDTQEDAIACLVNVFEDCISASELAQMKAELIEDGTYYFNNAGEAGAEYCEVTEESGENPEHYEEFTRQYKALQADDTVGMSTGVRRVALVEEDSQPTHFAVFAFGAYHATYVAVGYEPNPYHGLDICNMLEVAAGWLADNAPGCFDEPDYEEARADIASERDVAPESLSEEEVAEHAETDMTYTESGWLLSHEWTIVSENMERDDLLTWIRNV